MQLTCSAQRIYIASPGSLNRKLTCKLSRTSAFHGSAVGPRLQETGNKCRSRAGSLQVVSDLVHKVDSAELEKELAERQVPLIIDFYATWCGPCVLLAKELETVAKELGPEKVKILKIDTDQNPEISTQLQIQGLPTMVFIGMDKTKPALRTEGLLPAQTIKGIVENELSSPAPAPAA